MSSWAGAIWASATTINGMVTTAPRAARDTNATPRIERLLHKVRLIDDLVAQNPSHCKADDQAVLTGSFQPERRGQEQATEDADVGQPVVERPDAGLAFHGPE